MRTTLKSYSKNSEINLISTLKKQPLLYFVALPLLAVVIVGLAYYTFIKMGNIIDSDAASEVLLGKELLIEKKLFATEWFYSTEIHVVGIHLLIAPLLKLTGDMMLSKSIANMLLHIIISISFYTLMKSMRVKLPYNILIIALLLSPLSFVMLDVHLTGAYYSIYLIVIPLSLAGVNYINNWELSKNKIIILYAGLLAMALLMGMAGPRFVIMLYGPLLITEFIFVLDEFKKVNSIKLKDIRLWRRSIVAMGLAMAFVIGLAINKLYLARIAQYMDLGDQLFTSTEVFGSRVALTVSMLLSAVGANSPLTVNSSGGLMPVNIYAKGSFTVVAKFAFLVFAFFMAYRLLIRSRSLTAPRRTYVVFFWVSFILNAYLLIFTTVFLHQRYHLVIIALLFIIIGIYYDEIKEKVFSTVRVLSLPLLIVCVLSAQYHVLYKLGNGYHKNSDNFAIIETLRKNDLKFGYATFWNANILTLLTNGEIEVANLSYNVNKANYQWLSPKRYYDSTYHPGRTFLILTEEENSRASKDLLKDAKMIAKVRSYVIYVYEKNAFDF